MSNLSSIAFKENGQIIRIRHRLSQDLSQEEPVTDAEVLAIQTQLGGGAFIATVDTFAEMLALPTNATLKQVMIRSRTREPGVASVYSFSWGDTTTPEELPYNVARSSDGLGTFFAEI